MVLENVLFNCVLSSKWSHFFKNNVVFQVSYLDLLSHCWKMNIVNTKTYRFKKCTLFSDRPQNQEEEEPGINILWLSHWCPRTFLLSLPSSPEDLVLRYEGRASSSSSLCYSHSVDWFQKQTRELYEKASFKIHSLHKAVMLTHLLWN